MKKNGLYTCKSCGKKKPSSEYYLRKNDKVSEYKCKTCIKEKRKKHSENNYEIVRESNRKAVKKHTEKYPERKTARSASQRAQRLERKPKWLKDHHTSAIRSIYKHCRAISKKTKIVHHVDHIIPLQGKLVSGLHVPWNLQVIPAEENLRKSNKLIEDIV